MPRTSWKDVYDYRDGHTVEWIRGGPDYFDEMIRLIEGAKKNIHLQVYLIVPDEAGTPILDALKKASSKGIVINLVIDDFGADKITEADESELRKAGIIFKRFEPLFSSGKFYVGRRLHHKILLVDEEIALVGGINIANRYKGTPGEPPWLDYAIKVSGPVCSDLAVTCRRILERKFKPGRPKWPKIFTRGRYLDPSKAWVRIRKNDWLRNRAEITNSYNKSGRMATETITLVGGYFLPGRRYRRILAYAARRGVQVKIIMTRYSDVPIVKYATDYLYGWLMRNKIRIFESDQSMVHGKVVVVDATFASIGSYNQNHLSAFLSIELNLDVVNQPFAKSLHDHLEGVIENECSEITSDSYYRHASVFAKFRRWISYQVVRLTLRLLFVMNRIFTVND